MVHYCGWGAPNSERSPSPRGSGDDDDGFNFNDADGVYIETNGAISLSHVQALHNTGIEASADGNGFTLNNLTQTGNVTLLDCRADSNANRGYSILTLGTISLNNTNAWGNATEGAYVENASAGTPRSVTITKSAFNENHDGLIIASKGAVTLTGIWAQENTGNGVNINNTFAPAATPAAVSVTASSTYRDGLNHFDGNSHGLVIHSNGAVTVKDCSASDNTTYGVDVITLGTISATDVYVSSTVANTGGSFVNVATSTPKTVTITGSAFDGNTYGLIVTSKGAITVTGTSVSNNQIGMTLDNIAAPTPAAVSVTGGVDIGNHIGVNIMSHSAVTVKDIQILDSVNAGMNIYNNDYAGAITLTNVTASGSTAGYGVNIPNTTGTVLITNMRAEGNAAYGLYVGHSAGGATSVTINNSFFNHNTASVGFGVASAGAIIVYNTEANNNGFHGADLNNLLPGATATATITVNKSTFSGNGWYGLNVQSYHVITVNGVVADNNGSYGVALRTDPGIAINLLSTLRPNEFNGNVVNGLWVGQGGAVTGSKITANNNGEHGIYLNVNGAVNLTTGTVHSNAHNGILISTTGVINITGYSVMDNGRTADYSGMVLTTNGYNININTSIVTGNGK